MTDTLNLSQLKPDKRNARRHTPRNVGMIESSIQRHGFGRSVLLANDGTIIAGNATIDAAASAGLEDVIVVETDGTKVVAVQRTDVEPDSPEFHNLALADNRAAELAEWDGPVIAALIEEQQIDPALYWRDEELARVLQEALDDPNELWRGMPEFNQDDQMPVRHVIVNFASLADYWRFAELIEQPLTENTRSVWFPAQQRNDLKSMAFVDES